MTTIRIRPLTASALLAFAFATPLFAQGNGHNGKPPSKSPFPSPTAIAPTSSPASPLSWIDDATLLNPGTLAVTVSGFEWTGADLSETDFPVVGVSAGLTPRVQFGASIPRVVGDTDPSGIVGGVGTSYVSAKIGVLTGASGMKLAVAPTLQILAASALPAGGGRTQFGLPISAEFDNGPARLFASAGLFTGGARFVGGGVAVQGGSRFMLSASLSRAWVADPSVTGPMDRTELSGGATFFVRPQVGLFGSVAQTIKTLDQNGAGTTMGGGVTILIKTTGGGHVGRRWAGDRRYGRASGQKSRVRSPPVLSRHDTRWVQKSFRIQRRFVRPGPRLGAPLEHHRHVDDRVARVIDHSMSFDDAPPIARWERSALAFD